MEFVASAPGKVILFGEHAVVHGVPAVAGAVSDLRVFSRLDVVLSQPSSDTETSIELRLEDLPSAVDGKFVVRTWKVSALRTLLSELVTSNRELLHEFLPTPSEALRCAINVFLNDEHSTDKKALAPMLFLILGILHPDIMQQNPRGYVLRIAKANLPIGAGLGSSAAFCVTTCCVLLQARDREQVQSEPCTVEYTHLHPPAVIDGCSSYSRAVSPSVDTQELINKWAFAAEVFLHGNPSGLDNSISTFGGLIRYQRKLSSSSTANNTPVIEKITAKWPIPILLTNTRVPRETSVLVSAVRTLYETFPNVVKEIFLAVDQIVKRSVETLTNENLSEPEAMSNLATLVRLNQGLLHSLGVNHAAISKVCNVADGQNLATKLTGAGGGGCTMSLAGKEQEKNVQPVIRVLQGEGFECFRTDVGGPGVLVHHKH